MDWEECCEESADMDGEEDRERLLRFDEFLFGSKDSDSITAYVLYAIRTVNAIKFSIDWEPKSREFKAAYRITICARVERDKLAVTKNLEEQKKIYDDFRRRHEKIVTARNRLRRMYLVVRPSSSAAI